ADRLLAGRLTDAVRPDPGNLVNLRDQAGRVFTFDVTGADPAAVWGAVWGGENGIYTDDSSLAAAAVHAGVLKPGQRGPVRVRILPPQDHYAGSNRNGVTSESWESWGGSFQLLGVPGLGPRGGSRPGAANDDNPKPETGADNDPTAK